MIRVVAILETMWDWRGMTSGAGYQEAPRYFRINPGNFSGRRLYSLVGQDAHLLVTNACREFGQNANFHGKGDPVWLGENLRILDEITGTPGCIDVLLVCGKVAQTTYKACGYAPKSAVIEMDHPAARRWTAEKLQAIREQIAGVVTR